MFLRLGYEIAFGLPAATTMLALLYTHPSRDASLVRPSVLRVEPEVPLETFLDVFGNRCERLTAPAGMLHLRSETLVRDTGLPDRVVPAAREMPMDSLPPEVLQYLLPSRYCEVDLLSDIAWNLFGGSERGWSRVQAIVSWVYNHIEFGYHHARATMTARDVYHERAGVCRDFQHLAITLCRALNIPARYATGYLGDIGVPASPEPMDFSAWFEAYLDGEWHTFDARHNQPRIGRVLMAVGRDAADCALTTSFGIANLQSFNVWTDEVREEDDHVRESLQAETAFVPLAA